MADASGVADAPERVAAGAAPVSLVPWRLGPRCGRWFCADQLPRSGSAAAVGDIDGDGRPDLLLADTGRLLSTLGPLALLHNEGGMRFTDVTRRAGLDGFGAWAAAFGDLDNDGDADLVLGGRRATAAIEERGEVLVFYNRGHGRYEPPVAVPSWGPGVPLALDLADVNVDGRLDILVGLSGTRRGETYLPRVLEAQPDGTFAARAGAMADEGFTWVMLATDLDGDRFPDVLTGHDGNVFYQGTRDEPGTANCAAGAVPRTGAWLNAAYRNAGAPGDVAFAAHAVDPAWTSAENTPMSVVTGDFDADGRTDVMAAVTVDPLLFSVTSSGSLVARPDWPGSWRRRARDAEDRGVAGWGARAMDVDRDGDVDALMAYGVIPVSTTRWPNTVYLNERSAGLALAPEGTGFDRAGDWSALAAADFDGDGDDDLVLGAQTLYRLPCDDEAQPALLLTNVSEWPGRHWLKVRLVGTVSNRDGLGARVEVEAGGVTMAREVSRGGSTMSWSDGVVDFGLGEAAAASALRVRWPSGAVQTLANVRADRTVTVREPRWIAVDRRDVPRGGAATVRLPAEEWRALGAAPRSMRVELGERGRWTRAPAHDEATGDLVGTFTGDGLVRARFVDAASGLRAAVIVRFR